MNLNSQHRQCSKYLTWISNVHTCLKVQHYNKKNPAKSLLFIKWIEKIIFEIIVELFRNLMSLRKLSYSNILKISPPKTENFQIKNSDIFHISAQNID